MSRLMYTLVGDGDDANIVVFIPGEDPLVAHNSHPNFNTIVRLARDGDESLTELFDIAQTVATKFESLSERISTANGQLYLDGEPLSGVVTDHILRSMEAGLQDWQPLVLFIENLAQNPDQGSVDQLYAWLKREDFTIDTDGMIVGYKGVRADGSSIHSGRAIVNGTEVRGNIPNNPGDVITMPRSEVTVDSGVGCSYGLHVGSYDYASGFAQGRLLEVRVNPRDVVSVPTDCSAQKMRVCRYTVVDTIDQPYSSPVIGAGYNDPVAFDADFDLWGDFEAEDDFSF